MIRNYILTALRNFRKNKTYSFLNISGLAIGIACAGLIFLWVEDEMTFDDVHAKKDRLYRINVNLIYAGNMYTMGSTPRPMAAALKAEIPGIANAARVSDYDIDALFSFDNKSLYASGRYADSSLFNMLTLSFVQGNAQHAFDQLYSLVITESTAQQFFGEDRHVLGRTVRVDNKHDYVITGVIKDLPENSTLQPKWLAPYEIVIQEGLDRWKAQEGENDAVNWGSYGPFTYVELNAGANPAAINRQLKDFIRRKAPGETNQAFLFPMSDWRLHDQFENGKQTGGGRIKQVRMLSAIAWIILLIACINFMNLVTANSQKRAKEVGVRKVLGSDRKKLVFQFISEALFMSLLATLAAIIIILLALPAFNMLMQKQLSLHLEKPVHFITLLIITLICGLVAGSYPSMYLSSFNPVFVLKGLKLKTGSAALIRKSLVVFQFTVSVVFIISTLVVYMQIQHIKNRKLGFNRDNLIQINTQHDISKIFPLIKQELLHTGMIENAALSDHPTLYAGDSDDRFKWQGKPSDKEVSISYRNVSPEFISTSGMQVIEGRDFRANEPSENSSVIITQSLAKIMGEGSAVGKIIQSARRNEKDAYTNLTVAGVISDYVYGNVYGDQPGPVIFLCRPPENIYLIYVRIKPQNNGGQVLAKIEAIMKKNNPSYPFDYRFVDDQFNEMFAAETQVSKISGVFATLAIIISCLGLFGLAVYTAERRTKEIGIRKVLGASVAEVAGLLSKDFIKLVGLSCLVAFPVAWWIMHNWLQDYEYRIYISPWIFIGSGAMALLIALATISFQAIKAAVANPVRSLRTE